MSKILIAFFSRAGQNYVGGSIKNLPVGNTEVVARIIQEITGGDLFKIDTLTLPRLKPQVQHITVLGWDS